MNHVLVENNDKFNQLVIIVYLTPLTRRTVWEDGLIHYVMQVKKKWSPRWSS